ncbi:mRNA-capping enzyme subunit beta [Dispira parvispora]|uniref:mRNA-capping enzyme subunit beta n=1 Tax=Dispira parvispora TaxID=1520584 RepID=A0A9W8AQD2_9FUNG|nr:mRNA-capping enzyme subunit beta [Dispira parvispora]
MSDATTSINLKRVRDADASGTGTEPTGSDQQKRNRTSPSLTDTSIDQRSHHQGPVDHSIAPSKSIPRVPQLEPSIFGIRPIPDLVHTVGQFLCRLVDRPNVEIEAKLGTLVHNQTGQRICLPIGSQCVLKSGDRGMGGGPQGRWYRFESNMTLEQHRAFNVMFNKRVQASCQPGYRGAKVKYRHSREVDQYYEVPVDGDRRGRRVRVTLDQGTREVVPNGILEKRRIADLDIYCPNSHLDFRITVNEERPAQKPTHGELKRERHKDRLSYLHDGWKFDLTKVDVPKATNTSLDHSNVTYELELEFDDTNRFLEERRKMLRGDGGPHQYYAIVETFLNNINLLEPRSQAFDQVRR